MTRTNNASELHLTRLYDAPVPQVWDAFTDPQQVAQWWGPRGFTLTSHHKDLRPGGTWVYTMHGPDGVDYPNTTTYLQVERHALLVYDHGASEGRPPLFRVTVRFTDDGGKTRMDLTMALATPEAAAETRRFIKRAGGDATWDRLAEHLAEREGHERFVINRSFNAPIAQVFQVWTDPRHLCQWLPPTGFTMEFLRVDIRPGGEGFYVMANGAGARMYGRTRYEEVTPVHRLVYTQQFCDQHENVTRHPMAPTWPETMRTVVALTEEGPAQTRVTVTWAPHGAVTTAELAAFHNAKGSMTQGWTGSFDKLDEHLAREG